MTPNDISPRQDESGKLVPVKLEYAARRRRQGISAIPVGILAIATAAGGGGLLGLPQQSALAVVGVVVLGFFGYSLVNWRCPSCNRYFGQRLNPADCPFCGEALRD